MRCDQFHQQLNALLDEHLDPVADVELQSHASQCEHCARDLESWLVIAGSLPVASEGDQSDWVNVTRSASGTSDAKRRWLAVALAAAACLIGMLTWNEQPAEFPVAIAAGEKVEVAPMGPVVSAELPVIVTPQLDLDALGMKVSEGEWWGAVVVAAWKPVDPLAESIRPLTDSLQTALHLLTPRSGTRATPPSQTILDDAAAKQLRMLNSIA